MQNDNMQNDNMQNDNKHTNIMTISRITKENDKMQCNSKQND